MRYGTRRELVSCWVDTLSLVSLLIGGLLFAVAPLLGQSQEVINERTRLELQTVQRDVKALEDFVEAIDASSRLRILENDMAEVKWLGRTVAAVLIGQFVLAFWARREARRERDGGPPPGG